MPDCNKAAQNRILPEQAPSQKTKNLKSGDVAAIQALPKYTHKKGKTQKLIQFLIIIQSESNPRQSSRKRTAKQMAAGTVAAGRVTHVNNAQQLEKNVINAPRLSIFKEYATVKKSESHLKLDASRSTPVLQKVLLAYRKLISSKQDFNPVEVRKTF